MAYNNDYPSVKKYILKQADSHYTHVYNNLLREMSKIFAELDEDVQFDTIKEFEYYINNFKSHLLHYDCSDE